jgi:hypothetical protein
MLNLARILRFKFPDAKPFPRGADYLVQDDGEGPHIRAWDDARMGRSQPEGVEIKRWATEYEAAINSAH